jgi:hypothetical protein
MAETKDRKLGKKTLPFQGQEEIALVCALTNNLLAKIH